MPLSDIELINRAKSGNDSAFEELIYRYDKTVLGIALRYTGNRDEAKDLYQEVFIRIYRGLKKFEMKSEFSTWLYRITTNVCLSHKSRSKRQFEVSLSEQIDSYENSTVIPELIDEEMDPAEYSFNRELGKYINNAVESLSSKQRLAFLLKHYEGYKIREIAEMMNCKEGTIKKYLFEAVRNLRKKLEPIHQTAY